MKEAIALRKNFDFVVLSHEKTCLDVITDDEVQMIENSLNHRPRKVLQYKTPFEVFFSDSNFNEGAALRC